MEKKYVVPDFIVEAILSQPLLVAECAGKGMSITQPVAREVARRVCAALAENPIVPSHEQRIEMTDRYYNLDVPATTRFQTLFADWQRRMFLAPEPEVPETEREIIDGWLKRHQPNGSRISLVGDAMASELLRELEAYRRGKGSK